MDERLDGELLRIDVPLERDADEDRLAVEFGGEVVGVVAAGAHQAGQAERYRPLFDNTKRLRELISELQALSAQAVEQAEGWTAA